MIIDHVCICVGDFERSRSFYQAALAPLGYGLLMEIEGAAGFGVPESKPGFWFWEGPVAASTHVCFRASSREQVDAFHQACLAAGGRDNGAPGVREHYHPDYYAAYARDPDGYNIEAVCF